MEKEHTIPYTLFAKFFSGEISEEEQFVLDNFLAENPQNEKLFQDYEIIWSTNSPDTKFEDKTENALQTVKSNFNKELKTQQFKSRIIFRIAASILIVFSLSYFAYNLFTKDTANYLTKASGNEIIQIELPDGSEVIINKNSEILYPEQFIDHERRINFSGEAFFKIAHNPEKPFIIQSQETETKVLGTEFNLRSFKHEDIIELTLLEGKVLFTDTKRNKAKTLVKDEQIHFKKKNRELTKTKLENKNHLYWKTKEINLDGMSLRKISLELNSIFGTEIEPDKSIEELVYYQSLPFKNYTVQEILNTIKFTLNLSVDSVGNKILLKK
jgi:transmembrane sensor